MPAEPATKAQVQAYKFGVRRLESALANGDPLLKVDHRRRYSLPVIIGVVLTVLLLGGFAVYGFIRPQPSVGSAAVVVDGDTGAVYVQRNSVLYPAYNLASALLAAGNGSNGQSAPSVKKVDSASLRSLPRGQRLGIPGAPQYFPDSGNLVTPDWLACDASTVNPSLPPDSAPVVTTTVLLGQPAPTGGLLGSAGFLVKGATSDVYLLWSGVKSRIDPTDPVIATAFGLSDVTPRPISEGLLDAIPSSPDLTRFASLPPTDGAGAAYMTALGVEPGEVFSEQTASGVALYVALRSGVQQVSALVADLVRAQEGDKTDIPAVLPSKLAQAPLASAADSLAVGNYPPTRVLPNSFQRVPVICLSAVPNGSTSVETLLGFSALPITSGAQPVPVDQSAKSATVADAVYVPAGKGAVFQESSSTQSGTTGALFLVTEDGAKYPVASTDALTSLGLGGTARPAPANLLALLPTGAVLDPTAASRFANGTTLPSPTGAASG